MTAIMMRNLKWKAAADHGVSSLNLSSAVRPSSYGGDDEVDHDNEDEVTASGGCVCTWSNGTSKDETRVSPTTTNRLQNVLCHCFVLDNNNDAKECKVTYTEEII